MYDHILQLFDLHDKVAMVTGGAGWLGAAISQALAQCGASVSIIDINKDAIETIVNTIKEQGLLASGRVADVMKDISLRACIDDVAADHGRFDILINCAVKCPAPELDEVQFTTMDQGLHNSVSAYCIAAQQAVKHMRKNDTGTIINIASMYGMVTGYPSVYEGLTSPTSIVYQASKAAVIQMTRYMAVFWAGDHIRVNCISPGPFLQNDLPERMPEFARRISEKVPMGRFGKAEEIGGAAVFLASDASSFVTGHNLVVDGGWTAW